MFFALTIQAQLNKSSSAPYDSVMIKEKPGKLFTQFTNAFKPKSFTSSFTKEKKTLLNKAVKVNSSAAMAKNISSLAGFIKPEMFKSNFNVSSLQNHANTAKTIGQATRVLKDLENGIKPEAFSDVWKLQRSGWLEDLNKLK